MKFLVAMLNPDPREKHPYSSYPKDYQEYQSLCNQSQNKYEEGFHECVNFLHTPYGIEGYIPVWDNKAIRECFENVHDFSDEFVLISISRKGNNSDLNDRFIGIQAGCKYESWKGSERLGPMPRALEEALDKIGSPLLYNYHCYCDCYSLNLFSEKIMNATQIAIGEKWDGSLVTEITTDHFVHVVKAINKVFRREGLRFTNEYFKWEDIKRCIKRRIREEIENSSKN